MLMNLLICGATNFNSVELDEESPMSANSSPSSTPRRSSRFCKSNNNSNSRDKNPYATRGLDKFSALLAELEEKRRKIYADNGSDPDISFVRFVYKNSNDLVPVVVKLKDNKAKTKANNNTTTIKQDNEIRATSSSDQSQDKFAIETSVAVKQVDKKARLQESNGLVKKATKKILTRPSYYLPIVVMLILVLLAVFGRSVAILCTAIGWYVVPTLKENSTNNKRTSIMKRKDYANIFSERRIVSEGLVSSPRACFAGGSKDNNNNNKSSSTQHGHQKSW